MTLDQAKDQVAKTYGHPDWGTFRSDGMDWRVYEEAHDEVAELLAQSQVNDALDKAIEAVEKYCEPSHLVIEELKRLKR